MSEQFRLGDGDTLLGHLRGTWSVQRSLVDHSTGLTGNFTGLASFEPDDDGGLRHGERGTLVWAGSTPTTATRDLLWRSADCAHSAEVFFPDGRLFHRLDVSSGCDSPVHQCAPDVYQGTFTLDDPDRWHYTWRVSGPHKGLTLSTHLARIA